MKKQQEHTALERMHLFKIVSIMIKRASDICAYFAGILVILGSCLITLEVILRSFFKASTMISDQFVCYFYVGSLFLALAGGLLSERHIRITFLTGRLGGKTRTATDLFATIVGLVFVWALEVALIKEVVHNYQAHVMTFTVFQVPLWIPQLVMPVGTGLLGIVLILYLAIQVQKLRKQ